MMQIITREEAKARGLSYYFTGKPCKRGHVARRSMSGPCQECAKEDYHRKYAPINAEKNAKAKLDRIEKARLKTTEFCKKNGINFVTLDEAKANGLPRYFNGELCKRGHLSEKFTNTHHCVECGKERDKKWIKNNPEKRSTVQREYAERNKMAVAAKNKRWRENNPHKYAEYRAKQTEEQAQERRRKQREYARLPHNMERQRLRRLERWQNDPEYRIGRKIACQLRRSRIKKATLDGVDKSAIERFYREAILLSEKTNIPHDVDHIIPLKHDKVCGLHVPWNMQILTKSENIRKHNKWEAV